MTLAPSAIMAKPSHGKVHAHGLLCVTVERPRAQWKNRRNVYYRSERLRSNFLWKRCPPSRPRTDKTLTGSRGSLMPAFQFRLNVLSATIVVLAAASTGALAQKKYDVGATDTEIKIGNIMPYSGPASASCVIAKTETTYFHNITPDAAL